MSLQMMLSVTGVVLLVCWAVGAYNRLVKLKNALANSFGQIEVQLKRRHDLIPDLVDTTQKYLLHEQSILEAVIAARHHARSVGDAVRSRIGKESAVRALAAAEQLLDARLGQLFALFEAHPDLNADPAICELTEEFTRTANKVGFARQAYNDAVLDYNNAQGQFPAVLVARLFGFVPGAMLQATDLAVKQQAVRIGL